MSEAGFRVFIWVEIYPVEWLGMALHQLQENDLQGGKVVNIRVYLRDE